MNDKLTLDKVEKQLEEIINKMENEKLSFEESMKCYEDAAELLEFSFKKLNNYHLKMVDIEKRIETAQNSGETIE